MLRFVIPVCLWFVVLFSMPAHAAPNKENGLHLSPSRQSVSVGPGDTKTIPVAVANYTDDLLPVSFHVEQFAVDGKTHTTSFSPPTYDWIVANQNRIDLQPNKNIQASFTLTVPKNAADGEYYFALFASTQTTSKTVRVASLLYLYVDGGKVHRTNTIKNSSIPRIVMTGAVPFQFEIANTGNIHIEARTSAFLQGLSWYSASPDTHSIIIPGQSRMISGEVASPFMPGVYTLNYGFTDEASQKSTSKTATVIYIPPWSVAGTILLLLVVSWIIQRRHR